MARIRSTLFGNRLASPLSFYARFSTENPIDRTVNKIKSDFDDLKAKLTGQPPKRPDPKAEFPKRCDVLIMGGGVMGSSAAYWLKQRALSGLDVVVIEKDFTVKFNDFHQKSSTVLSVGGLRQQFSLKENIQLSLESAEFMRNIELYLGFEGADPVDIQFHPSGYLFLASDASAHVLQENAELQTSLGAKVELLSPEKLKAKFPWINTEGIALGCHGLENEGWFDPWSLLNAFRKKAVYLGVQYIQGEVIGFTFKDSDHGKSRFVDQAIVRLKTGEECSISMSTGVLACGAQSGAVSRLFGPQDCILPVEPRKRYVYNIHCPDGPGMNCPLVIDPSGAYFRREGLAGNYLCGKSPLEAEEPPVDDLEVDHGFFEDQVWPLIAARCPLFEKAKVKSAWAGYYDFNNFDENAFIGPHPGLENIILATGFSGHGIQQSPAVGRAVQELIIDGGFKTLDLDRLGFSRFTNRQPLWESNIV